jgi:hypothetical protein
VTPEQEVAVACLNAALNFRNQGVDAVVEITTRLYNHITTLSDQAPKAPVQPASKNAKKGGLPFE